jgi:hypothetical protein
MSYLRLTVLLIFVTLFSEDLHSQSTFREGYIVKNTGEVIEGLVGYSGNKIPDKCSFKRFDIAVIVSYGPDDIAAFGYKNSKRYESVLNEGRKLFLEILVKGYLTLFCRGSEYYISRNNSNPAQIKQGLISWNEEYPKKEFQGPEEFLKYLSSGKTEIKSKIDLDVDLVPIISSINHNEGKNSQVFNADITKSEISQKVRQTRGKTNWFGLVYGVNIYSLELKNKSHIFLPVPDRETAMIFGLSYERVVSMSTDRWSVRADLLYLRQDFYSYTETDESYTQKGKNDAFFDFTALKVPLQLQYTFRSMKYVPYLNGGISGMFLLNNHYSHIKEFEVYPNDIYISELEDMKFSPVESGITIGGGIKTKLLNNATLRIEARLEAGSGIFDKKFPAPRAFSQHSLQTCLLVGISF